MQRGAPAADEAVVAIDPAQFGRMLRARFPDVAAGIDPPAAGLLHCEMQTLARAAQVSFDGGDVRATRDLLALADLLARRGDELVRRAITVSFVGELDFAGELGNQLRALLTPALRLALAHVEAFGRRRSDGAADVSSSQPTRTPANNSLADAA